jgi:hypothetical protein
VPTPGCYQNMHDMWIRGDTKIIPQCWSVLGGKGSRCIAIKSGEQLEGSFVLGQPTTSSTSRDAKIPSKILNLAHKQDN